MIHWLQNKVAFQYSKLIPKEKIIVVAGSLALRETAADCKAVLTNLGEVVSSSDFIESDQIIPQTLLKTSPNTKKAILEFKSKSFGQTVKFLKVVSPNIGIVVGLDYTNAETLGNFDQIIAECSKVLLKLPVSGAAILNWDDLNCRKLATQTEAEVIFFGTDKKNCHLWAGNISLKNQKISFELNYGVERVEINTLFIAKYQIYPFLAAAALGVKEGLRLTQIKKSLESLGLFDNQLKLKTGFNNCLVLDSSSQDSTYQAEQALDVLNYLPARRRVLVLGEIKRLGDLSQKFYKSLAQKIYQNKLDLVLVEKGPAQMVANELVNLGFITDRMESDLTNPQIVSKLLKILAKGDLVLVLGSKEVRLDEVVSKITKNNS